MLHLDELLDSGGKLRLLLHQCSELFLHRQSKTLRESNQLRYHVSEMFFACSANLSQTHVTKSVTRENNHLINSLQETKQGLRLTITSARKPCTACPCGAQLPLLPQMRWGISSRSRKGSVLFATPSSDEVRSPTVVRHVCPTELLHDCSNIIVNSGGLCHPEESSNGLRFRQHVGGVLLSRDLADFEQFPSKGFLSPKELDLHVANFAETEPRYDRLGRGAVDPDKSRQCNGRLCAAPMFHRPAVNLCHASTGGPSRSSTCSPVRVRENVDNVFVCLTTIVLPHKLGYFSRHLAIRFMRASPLTRGFDICLHVSFDANCKSILSSDTKVP